MTYLPVVLWWDNRRRRVFACKGGDIIQYSDCQVEITRVALNSMRFHIWLVVKQPIHNFTLQITGIFCLWRLDHVCGTVRAPPIASCCTAWCSTAIPSGVKQFLLDWSTLQRRSSQGSGTTTLCHWNFMGRILWNYVKMQWQWNILHSCCAL